MDCLDLRCQNHFKLNDTIKQIVTMTDTIPADKDTGTAIQDVLYTTPLSIRFKIWNPHTHTIMRPITLV